MERRTVDSLLRSTQAYCSQVCDKQTLDHGIAYYCDRFPNLPEANQFREVVAQHEGDISQAYEQAESLFNENGLFCYRWAPAEGRPSESLASFLQSRGFHEHVQTALLLTEWVDPEPPADTRVLPARAMRATYRKMLDRIHAPSMGDPMQVSEARLERLDDPQFDMFVALREQQPAGCCALYQVGDIARIMDLTVVGEFTGHGVDRALLGHVLALAKRLMMRTICTQLDAADEQRRRLLETLGFVTDGEIVEFERNRD